VPCSSCVCDPDCNRVTTAADALRILLAAVGLEEVACCVIDERFDDDDCGDDRTCTTRDCDRMSAIRSRRTASTSRVFAADGTPLGPSRRVDTPTGVDPRKSRGRGARGRRVLPARAVPRRSDIRDIADSPRRRRNRPGSVDAGRRSRRSHASLIPPLG
jgi:hypothetical protein